MGTKKVRYKREDINNLPDNMPVRYDIYNTSGNLNYIGSAKKGRVKKEIASKIGKIPGATVKIHQRHRISEARKEEGNAIKRNKPPYNKRGK